MRRGALLIWIVPMLLIAAGCGGEESTDPAGNGGQPEKGPEKPAVVVPDVEPNVVHTDLVGLMDVIEAERKKPLVVHLWANWCPDCLGEMPHIVAMKSKLGDKADFVAVSFDFTDNQKGHPDVTTAVEVVKAAAKGLKMGFPVHVAEGPDAGAGFYSYFEVEAVIPQTVVYDAEGTKLGAHAEFASADDAVAWFEKVTKK